MYHTWILWGWNQMLKTHPHLPGSSGRDLIWTHKWPFQGLSDLHLGNQMVPLKKLAQILWFSGCQLRNIENASGLQPHAFMVIVVVGFGVVMFLRFGSCLFCCPVEFSCCYIFVVLVLVLVHDIAVSCLFLASCSCFLLLLLLLLVVVVVLVSCVFFLQILCLFLMLFCHYFFLLVCTIFEKKTHLLFGNHVGPPRPQHSQSCAIAIRDSEALPRA